MKSFYSHYCRSVAMVVGVLAMGRVASADMPPIPWIHEVTQEEQDVKIRVEYEGRGDALTVTRTQGAEETEIVSVGEGDPEPAETGFYCDGEYYDSGIQTQEFCDVHPDVCLSCSEDEDIVCLGEDCDTCTPVGSWIYSWNAPYGSDFCEMYPEFGNDCDGDGIYDCCFAECATVNYYEFWDFCVPPGLTEYKVYSDPYIEWSTEEINVEDTQDACLNEGDDDENDNALSDIKIDIRCQVANAGATAAPTSAFDLFTLLF